MFIDVINIEQSLGISLFSKIILGETIDLIVNLYNLFYGLNSL